MLGQSTCHHQARENRRVGFRVLALIILLFVAPSPCAAQARTLWHNPGAVEHTSFAHAAGRYNAPRPPFHFVEEKLSGNTPKIIVRDGAGVEWRVKWGLEVHAENFATRLVGALGYYVDPTWFVARGKIIGAHSLGRAARFVGPGGSFSNASFERRDPNLRSLPGSWAWNHNLFIGTNQLNGLKVVIMLLANWDNKDGRDAALGSNTAIAARRVSGRQELVYSVSDWGQALGGWGPGLTPQTWSCDRFTAQTASFVQGREGIHVRFNFIGQHTEDFKNDITIADVRWLMRYLGRITDGQLRSGLKASGATAAEVTCFAAQLRKRITRLRTIVGKER
jgi:hypothetical protein